MILIKYKNEMRPKTLLKINREAYFSKFCQFQYAGDNIFQPWNNQLYEYWISHLREAH